MYALRPSDSRDSRRSTPGVAIRDICMVNIEKRVKLKGVLERTASSVEIKGDGSLYRLSISYLTIINK
jgi:hypothetical protein